MPASIQPDGGRRIPRRIRAEMSGMAAGKEKGSPQAAFHAGENQADQAAEALPRMAPNFWLNFSTRPAVSTIFCLPVYNGWHREQTSMCKASLAIVDGG